MFSRKAFCICFLLQLSCAYVTDTYYGFQQVGTSIQTGLFLVHTTEQGQTTGPMEIYMNGYENVQVDEQNQTLRALESMIKGGQQLQVSKNEDGPTKDLPLNIVQFDTISLTLAVKKKDRAVLTLTNAKLVPVEHKQQ